MSYFNFDNKRVYYTEFGTGTPLLLLHGNTASSNIFAEMVNRYGKYFKVILIDFLGHGKSDRLSKFPADLWFNEAEQVITFLREKQYTKVNIIGSSGGVLVAINVALEIPELVNKVIADSFEGEKPIKTFIENVEVNIENSKHDENAKMFYANMHGSDWEQVVDNDTNDLIIATIDAVYRSPDGIAWTAIARKQQQKLLLGISISLVANLRVRMG